MVTKKTFSPSWVTRLAVSFALAFLIWGAMLYSQRELHSGAPILQGEIFLDPKPSEGVDKIRAGAQVTVRVRIENIGHETSSAGQAFVRYAFSKPLDTRQDSSLFQTEKAELPPIAPGKFVDIAFTSSHKWPSLFDYIRHDWAMREYQAFVEMEGKEHLIGSLAVTVSAYYYPGMKQEYPVEVPPFSETVMQNN